MILVETELTPLHMQPEGVAPTIPFFPLWQSLWDHFKRCLQRHGIDPTVPTRLHDIVVSTGRFENVMKRNGNIPVGFWPEGSCNVYSVGWTCELTTIRRICGIDRWTTAMDGLRALSTCIASLFPHM